MSNKKHQLDYVYPPDIQKCQSHRLATRIFKGLNKDQFGGECQCCERRIGDKNATGECCYDNIKLAFIGPGIPLFFAFIKNSIILLVALVCIFVAFAIYSNLKGGDCVSQGSCSDNVFDTLAIINKVSQTAYLTIQNYMLLGFVILSIFIFQYFRYNFRKIQDECDDIITSPSDYAMILRRLPEGTEQVDIQKMIQTRRAALTPLQRQKTQNLRVVSIVMSFAMGQYTRTKIANKQEFTKLLDEGKHEQFTPKPLPPLQKTGSIAIVVFATQESKQLFSYRPNIFQKLLQCIWTPCIPRSNFQVKGQKIAIQRAPEPDDIVWQNSKISQKGAIIRKGLYSLFSICLLFVGGAIQYGLAVAQTKANQDSQTQMVFSTFSSIAVTIINAIIQIFLVFTSKKERNETITEFNTVLMVKISFFQFLNTGVFVVAANFLAEPTNFSLSKGFVFQVTQVMIMNAVTPNLSLLITNYCQVVQKIKRCLIQKGKIKNSQLEANYVYQGPEMQIPYKYAYIFKTIWLTAFYAPLAPIVVPISIGGLTLNYMIQKCLFGKTYSIPNTTSSMVNDSAIQLLQYFPLILSIGEYIIYLYFLQFKPDLLPVYWSIPIYASIALSGLNLLLPMDTLNEKLFSMPSDNFVYPSYEKVQDKFEVTYQMTNPGYVCKRKRKRDLFVLGALFGQNGMDMTGVGMLLGGMGQQSQNKAGLMNGQNPIYGNNNGNPNNIQNPNLNNMNNMGNINNANMNNMNNNANPFAALIAPPVKQPSPNNRNINVPLASPSPTNKPQLIKLTAIGVAPNFLNPQPQLHHQNSNNPLLNESVVTDNEQPAQQNFLAPNKNKNVVPNNNKPPTFNANNSFVSSMTGGFPSVYNGNQNPINQKPNQSFVYPPNNLAGSNVSLPISQPPSTYSPFPMNFNNQISNNQSFSHNNIPPQLITNPGSINIAPQSSRSSSSSKQIRKALKMQEQNQNKNNMFK